MANRATHQDMSTALRVLHQSMFHSSMHPHPHQLFSLHCPTNIRISSFAFRPQLCSHPRGACTVQEAPLCAFCEQVHGVFINRKPYKPLFKNPVIEAMHLVRAVPCKPWLHQ